MCAYSIHGVGVHCGVALCDLLGSDFAIWAYNRAACLSLFTQSIGSVCKFSLSFFISVMLTSKEMVHIILRDHY